MNISTVDKFPKKKTKYDIPWDEVVKTMREGNIQAISCDTKKEADQLRNYLSTAVGIRRLRPEEKLTTTVFNNTVYLQIKPREQKSTRSPR